MKTMFPSLEGNSRDTTSTDVYETGIVWKIPT